MPQQTLFDLPIEDVTYDMVDAFLTERHREDVRIEYKTAAGSGLPGDVLDPITAMSNTAGGLVLVGVDDDPKDKGFPVTWPKLPRKIGKSDQEDALLSKIASSIVPRPQVRVRFLAPDTSPDVGILVVQVVPGTRLPYWCPSKGICVRHGDQDRIADLATIEYLFERRERGSYTTEQAREQNWFAPLEHRTSADPTILRVVLGPLDRVQRPPLSRSLDSWAEHLLLGPHIPRQLDRTIHPSFGEDFFRLLARRSPDGSTYFDVTAYSDGVTRWHIPLQHSDTVTPGGAPHQEALNSADLQRNLYTAAALGKVWMTYAAPDYQGAMTYEVEVHNVKGKYMHIGPTQGDRRQLGFDTETWRGSITLNDPNDFLDDLKELYYRFLRSGQLPDLQDDANRRFDTIAIEWKSTL